MTQLESVDVASATYIPTKAPIYLLVVPRLSGQIENCATENILSLEKWKTIGNVHLVSKSLTNISGVIDEAPCFLLKRTRSIPSLSKTRRNMDIQLRYALVTYRFQGPKSVIKKKVQRLIRRSIAVRIRPGVLLFPYLRAKDNGKLIQETGKKALLNSKEFVHEVSLLGAKAYRWTHLEFVRAKDQLLMQSIIERMLSLELQNLEKKIIDLRQSTERMDVSLKRLRERLSELKGMHQELNHRYTAIQKIWEFDSTRQLRRVYNLLLSVRRKIRDLRG